MKPQDKSSGQRRFSASVLGDLRNAYRALDCAVGRQPWLAQGSLNVKDPKSPSANVTYTWTRKVRAKTVTVALSRQQATAFGHAIAANRRVEAILCRLREVSQTALLAEVPGVTKRRSDGPQHEKGNIVLKGA